MQPDESSIVWNETSKLTLTFDNELQYAAPDSQDGVRFYYWYHVPGINIDFDKKEAKPAPGYVLVFMALKDPTYTNYNMVRVIGGGIRCEVLAAHVCGAVIRAQGDMRGRTLEIWFSKNPMPVTLNAA